MSTSPMEIEARLDGPAMEPPPGGTSNFIDPPILMVPYVITLVLCLIMSTLALAMRLYTKFCIIRKNGWEDYTLVLGFLMWVAYCVLSWMMSKTGAGVHQWNVQLKDFIDMLYYTYTASTIYGPAMAFVKLSILLQYLQIFTTPGRASVMRWCVYAMIVINFLFYIGNGFVQVAICHPRKRAWSILSTSSRCVDTGAIYITGGILNSFSDFVMLLLPQHVIWKLQMPRKKKIGVSAIFLMGFFVCIASIMRLYYTLRFAQTGDVTYNIALMGFWTLAELSTAIVCCCLPVLPRFYQKFRDQVSTLTKPGSSTRSMLHIFRLSRPSKKHINGNGKVTDAWNDSHGLQSFRSADYVSPRKQELERKGLTAYVADVETGREI